MAEEQKNVEVLKDTKVEETTPAVEAPKVEAVAETKVEETPAPAVETAAATTTEEKATEEAKPAEETKAEEKKEEVKPVEEGHLGHKAQGLSFPKNLIASKEFFFFGAEAFEAKALAAYKRTEKSAETAHANIAWATETAKGLLFIGDKKAPTGIINLSDASEPETDGTHKFTLTSKGNKHSFKATSAAERDNWVAQLKLKIAEAKELATTVTESETYKKTLESFKPAPVKKEEKPVEAAKTEEAPKTEEAKTEETPAAAAEEAKPEEVKPEEKAEKKAESPKPANKKRSSFFGFAGFNSKKEESKEEKKEEKKEEVKAEEAKPEETPAVEETKAEETPVVAAETKPEETPAVAAEEAKPEEAKPVESPKDKASKRNSFFGNVFSKKDKKAAEPKADEAESPKEVAATTESAPVIPPVESTTPLAVEVSSPATVPTETTETTAAVASPTNGEPRKDAKEKRKSSIPFLGKREKSPSGEGEERSKSPFSKLRATIKGKTSHKTEEKPAEEAVKEEPAAEEAKAAEAKPEETKAEETKAEEVKEEAKPTETKPEAVAAPAPVPAAA
ncbi:unnamed protein product [Clonostachys solani]|uniref:PH domain-containing protein n=1 Tax=Clonostachys solani TaxID=160281 RepID=A0A9N9ZK88_9HYPO|nr:unnamed protein product [Clonostachys solani]